MKIGIYGFGFVGSAVYNNIKNKNNIRIYDKFIQKLNSVDNYDKITETDILFVCVPTPLVENKIDFSAITETLEHLMLVSYQGIVVIKSTVLPEFINYNIRNNTLNLVSNPEFLIEHKSNEDFKNQEVILLGGRSDLCEKVAECYRKEFDLNNFEFEFCSFDEALMFKYLRNIKLGYDVLFTNFMYQTTKNHRKYMKLFEKIPVKQIQDVNLSPDGKLGFGGNCLPKDTIAYNSYIENNLTEYMIKYNNTLR